MAPVAAAILYLATYEAACTGKALTYISIHLLPSVFAASVSPPSLRLIL